MDHRDNSAWYEYYFGSDYLLIDIQNNTAIEVEFLYHILKLDRKVRLLDVGCGYGRHLIPLLGRNVDVYGCDLSRFLLDNIVQNICDISHNNKPDSIYIQKWGKNGPKLVQCDNRILPFYKSFDCACNMFNSFGYFKDEHNNFNMLKAIAGALKPGGLFLLDLVNRDFVIRMNSRKDWFEHDNAIILEKKWFDPILNRSEIDVTVIDKCGKRDYHHSIRLYSFTELEMLLKAAGFFVRAVFGGFKNEEFDPCHDRMLILAQTLETEDE